MSTITDWIAIKTEYITTSASLRDLAAKNNLSKDAVARHCAKEHWVELREQYHNEVARSVTRKTAEAVADAYADRNAVLTAAGERSAQLLTARLEQIMEEGKVKSYEVKAIAEALKTIRDLYRTDIAPDDDDTLAKYLEAIDDA